MKTNKLILSVIAAVALLLATRPEATPAEQRLLYVASPGIRNYVEHGGIGVLVFDIDHGYKFVKRIPTWKPPADAPDKPPENVKGIAASAKTGRLYVTNLSRVICIDLLTDKILWDNAYEGGCDRLAISPDGALLYVPSLRRPALECRRCRHRFGDHQNHHQFGGAQYDLWAGRFEGLSCRAQVAGTFNRRHKNEERDQEGGPVQQRHSSVHNQRRRVTLLCQRQ